MATAPNLILVGLFYSALIRPVDFKGFIYKTGLMIYIIEFMSLHSSGMFFGAAQKKKTGKKVMTIKIVMFAFYNWFPFPPEVTSARPSGQSGLFINTPQTLMAWGVICFTLMTLCELMIFRRSVKGSGEPYPGDNVTTTSLQKTP